jgi:hypothetical protein
MARVNKKGRGWIKKDGTAGGEAVPPKVVTLHSECDYGEGNRTPPKRRLDVYVEAKYLEMVNKTVHEPNFFASHASFFCGRREG